MNAGALGCPGSHRAAPRCRTPAARQSSTPHRGRACGRTTQHDRAFFRPLLATQQDAAYTLYVSEPPSASNGRMLTLPNPLEAEAEMVLRPSPSGQPAEAGLSGVPQAAGSQPPGQHLVAQSQAPAAVTLAPQPPPLSLSRSEARGLAAIVSEQAQELHRLRMQVQEESAMRRQQEQQGALLREQLTQETTLRLEMHRQFQALVAVKDDQLTQLYLYAAEAAEAKARLEEDMLAMQEELKDAQVELQQLATYLAAGEADLNKARLEATFQRLAPDAAGQGQQQQQQAQQQQPLQAATAMASETWRKAQEVLNLGRSLAQAAADEEAAALHSDNGRALHAVHATDAAAAAAAAAANGGGNGTKGAVASNGASSNGAGLSNGAGAWGNGLGNGRH